MEILSILLTTILIAVSILIVLVVLLQRPKQEGLGAAFGGSTLDSALGAHTTDVLQKITKWFGIIFFVSAIGLAMVKSRQFRASAASNVMENVENKAPSMPDVPPSVLSDLQNAAGSDTPDATDASGAAAPAVVPAPAPAGQKAPEAPKPAADSDKPAPKKAAEKAKKAAKAKVDQAVEKGKAKAKQAVDAVKEKAKSAPANSDSPE